MWAYFPKGSMFIILNTDYATLSFSFLSLSVCNFCVLFFVLVCLAGRGTCSHTPAVCRVAGPRRTGRPFRLPAVHQLSQGEEERWRATNGTLQVTHKYTQTHTQGILKLPARPAPSSPLNLMPCLFWITFAALGLGGQVFWSPWKRRWVSWTRVSQCPHWTLSKHWEINEPWWFRPRYRDRTRICTLWLFSASLTSLFYDFIIMIICIWRDFLAAFCFSVFSLAVGL